MKKTTYFDKDEQELAESLETENWISDLDAKEKNQYEKTALYSLNTKKISIKKSAQQKKSEETG